MKSCTVITTKSSLRSLADAAKSCGIDIKIFHVGDWAAHDVKFDDLSIVTNSDIILLDIRSGVPEEIVRVVKESKAKVVVPLVPATATVVSLLKLDDFTGEKLAEKFRVGRDVDKIFKVVDAIEKLGSAIPIGVLKHYRNWIMLTKYWAYWGKENLKNMFKLILSEYFGVKVKYEKPKEVGELQFWDPKLGFYDRPKFGRKSVLIFMYPGMHFDQDAPVAEKLKEYLERRGLNVVCATGGITKKLLKQLKLFERVNADAVVNLQWFLVNGGPYGGPLEPTRKLFLDKGFLLFNGLIMYMNRISRWEKSDNGLLPIETVAGVILPEMDGAIEPIPSAGLDDGELGEVVVLDERVKKKAERVANWIELKYKPREERRVAIIVYNYPPGEHNVGDASYLDTLRSLEILLKSLKEWGYKTEVKTKKQLKEVLPLVANSPAWGKQVGEKLSLGEYLNNVSWKRVVKTWGEPPGNVNVKNGDFVIPGVVLGNVFVGVQPSRGTHEALLDGKLYHSKDLPPHHQYLAFYYWIREVFKADVIVHLGTHGTLEFLPGKEVGLSRDCWPDVLIGNVPHVYIYHVTNPSEMAVAKRRSYAYVITHSSPPFENVELYGEYAEIERLIEEMKHEDEKTKAKIKEIIKEKCLALNLNPDNVEEYLYEMKKSLMPKGLHVLGENWSDEDILNYLAFVLRRDGKVKSLHKLLGDEERVKDVLAALLRSEDVKEVIKACDCDEKKELEESLKYALELAKKIHQSNELYGIMRALDGYYVEPRVAGDPVRTPEVFPTGSHGYPFDARLIPSEGAAIRGAEVAELTLKKFYKERGRYPETVGVVLWGFETAQTRGETIGQILQYLGVRLVRREGPWAPEIEVIPLEELGRPRVDVVVTICGIFRDVFPNLIEIIDRAFKRVAELDESPEENYVKKHSGNFRIFGPKPGSYNTRLTELVETSEWRNEDELAKVYIEDMTYAYGEGVHGVKALDEFLDSLKRVDVVCQIRSSAEYEILDLDHYYEFFGGLKRAVEKTKGEVSSYWIDTLFDEVKVKSGEEAIEFAARTRLLNPKWIDEMLKHGYDGVREIAKRVEYLLGHSALTGVDSWVWEKVCERFVLDDEVREKMQKENPWAVYEIVKKIYEAYERGYWVANEKSLEELREVAGELEGYLER